MLFFYWSIQTNAARVFPADTLLQTLRIFQMRRSYTYKNDIFKKQRLTNVCFKLHCDSTLANLDRRPPMLNVRPPMLLAVAP